MALTIAVNTGTQDTEYGSSGAEWTDMATGDGNDGLIYSKGNDVVKDGEPIPSQSELMQAGVVLDQTQKAVPKYFLKDISANEIKEIDGMGNENKRYVLAFSFDSAGTASEPVFELWDDTDLDSADIVTLGGDGTVGSGVPSSSWWRGITTTAALPGVDWALSGGFSRLAGASDSHFLWLNDQNGALSGADILYCNICIIIPASILEGGSATPIFVCKYNSN